VAEWADENPNMTDMPPGSSHWRVTLRYKRRQMTISYSMGPAHSSEPKTADVLGCLVSDANGYIGGRDFEDWCQEYGYDTDSRKAERTWNAVQKQTRQLERLLGPELLEEAFQAEW
jgi:hypothetical protein